MSIRIIFIFFIFFGFSSDSFAQSINFLPTAVEADAFMYNPAHVGKKNGNEIRLRYRKQWEGFQESPNTFAANYQYGTDRLGVGLYTLSDVSGGLQHSIVGASYAYKIKVSENTTLNTGLTSRLAHACLSPESTRYGNVDMTDAVLADAQAGRFTLDFATGLLLKNEKWEVSAAVENMGTTRLNQTDGTWELQEGVAYNAGALVHFKVGKATVSPGIYAQKLAHLNTQTIAMLRCSLIEDKVYFGGSYRSLEGAIGGFFGFNLDSGFNLNISYDMPTSQIQTYNDGSLDLSIGYNF